MRRTLMNSSATNVAGFFTGANSIDGQSVSLQRLKRNHRLPNRINLIRILNFTSRTICYQFNHKLEVNIEICVFIAAKVKS